MHGNSDPRAIVPLAVHHGIGKSFAQSIGGYRFHTPALPMLNTVERVESVEHLQSLVNLAQNRNPAHIVALVDIVDGISKPNNVNPWETIHVGEQRRSI